MIEALKELRQIIKMRDQKAFLPTKIREEALEEWIRRWIVETSYSQSILNPKALTSEMEDMLKEHVTRQLVETLTEEVASFKRENKSLSAEMVAIRRKPTNG